MSPMSVFPSPSTLPTPSGLLQASLPVGVTQPFTAAFDPLLTKLTEWGTQLVAMLPNLAVALGVMAAVIVLSGWASRAVAEVTRKSTDNPQLARLGGIAGRIGVLALGTFLALSVLQLDKTVTSLLAGAGVAGVAIGFAVQGVAASVVSGLVISTRRPFHLGDLVKLGEHLGTVDTIDFRSTQLTLLTGERVELPNHKILEGPILNYSRAEVRRIDVAVGVSYDADLPEVESVARAALESLTCRADGQPIDVLFTGFGGSSIDLVARFRIRSGGQVDVLQAKSEAIMRIKAHFDDAGIDIPFPIRTLELGGSVQPLHETLRAAS